MIRSFSPNIKRHRKDKVACRRRKLRRNRSVLDMVALMVLDGIKRMTMDDIHEDVGLSCINFAAAMLRT